MELLLLLLLVASALAAQGATSGPVRSSLRGAVGNSSRQALLRAGSAPCSASTSIGKNSQGTNLRQADWSNVAEDCCNQCNSDSARHAWTWIDGSHECWLKSSVPDESQWTSEEGVFSGLRTSARPSLAPPSGCSSSAGKNSHGTNLRQADWSNVAADCCRQCDGDSACHAWTWIDGSHECWLKSSVPDESQWASEDGVTSGLCNEDETAQFLGAAASSGSWTFYDNQYITADCKIPKDDGTSDFEGFSGKISEAKRMCEEMQDCVGLTGGRDPGDHVDDEYTMFVYFMNCNDVRTNNEGWISYGL